MAIFNEVLSSAKVIVTELIPLVYRTVSSSRSVDEMDNIPLRLTQIAEAHPNKTAVIFEGKQITWSELDNRASKTAEALRLRGVKPGECVSLLMDNRIEFLENWLGVMRTGAIVSLVNTHLPAAQLAHCIEMSASRILIFGEEYLHLVATMKEDAYLTECKEYLCIKDSAHTLTEGWPSWVADFSAEVELTEAIRTSEVPQVSSNDHAMYIFTSGTTGLPKASIQRHQKFLLSMNASGSVGLKLVANDCLYLCLPLYHATGLLIGFAAALHSGATVFLRRKFSATHFLDDVRQNNCNAFVYIGELCRYLLAQPEKSDDGDNPLTKITGNGLRPDIWMAFKARFRIEKIVEFYGASEGNTAFINVFNRDKTIGTAIIPPALVAYDVANDEIVRDAAGRCLRVAAGQPGLLLGPITKRTEFVGYTDKEATKQKILRDVFEEGDAYFNTGDLIKTVDVGFCFGFKHYQFVDRVGDTFRWKGENCSTNEIAETIHSHPHIDICNVFGVDLPGTDGKAGMAAIVLKDGCEFEPEDVSKVILESLASYAQPVFIRVLTEQVLTGTFKLQKNELRTQAYHHFDQNNRVYVLKPGASQYEPLDDEFYDLINAGNAGF